MQTKIIKLNEIKETGNFNFPKKSGFTLVEMIVSLALFSIVAVVALGAMVRIISANQKAQALQAAMTNLNFALDAMSREIRVGTYLETFGTADVDPGIKFVSTRSTTSCELRNAYRFIKIDDVIHLQKAEVTSCGAQPVDNDYTDLISPNITITNGSIGYDSSTNDYKLIRIEIIGSAGSKEKIKTYFNVRTAISARVY